MKFELGYVVVTSTAADVLHRWGKSVESVLARHQAGDWGDLSEELRQLNERALTERMNVVSVYEAPDGKLLNIFTRADRTLTLVHLGL